MLLPESALLSCIFGRRRATSVVVAAAIDTLLCFTKPRLLRRERREDRGESERVKNVIRRREWCFFWFLQQQKWFET